MIVCFRTEDLGAFALYISNIKDKIASNVIGVVFKSIDYVFFILKEESGVIDFLVLLRVDYVLPNIVPKKFLANRILKSLRIKGGVKASLIKSGEALNLLLDYNCGDGL